MRIVDDLDKGNIFCVIGNRGITFFDQGSAKKFPGADNWFWCCRCCTVLLNVIAGAKEGGEQ